MCWWPFTKDLLKPSQVQPLFSFSSFCFIAHFQAWYEEKKGAGVLFITPSVFADYNKRERPLPTGIIVCDFDKDAISVQQCLAALVNLLSLTGVTAEKTKRDLIHLIQASVCQFTSLPLDKTGDSTFVTRNMSFVRRCLQTTEKKDRCEVAINDYGMEHLVEVVTVRSMDLER